MNIDLEALGISKEELQDRVVNTIADNLLTTQIFDEDGDPSTRASSLRVKLDTLIKTRVDETIKSLAEQHVLPNVSAQVETVMMQETNRWGEKSGAAKPVGFIEYLTLRAEAYLKEKVDSQGRGKDECDSYGWSGNQTRVVHLVNNHLHNSITKAMQEALTIANSAITTGIQETVKIKLAEIVNGLRLSVTTK